MLNKLFQYFAFFLVVTTLISCARDTEEMTPSGFKYVTCEDKPGAVVVNNEYAFFDMTIRSGDSIIQSSNSAGRPYTVQVLESNEQYGAFTPVIEMLRNMSIGDSAVLYYPLDSFPQPPPGSANLAPILAYEVCLKDIMDQTRYTAYMEEQNKERQKDMLAAQGRESIIADLIAQVHKEYKAGELDDEITRTDSGLGFHLLESGTANTQPAPGEYVSVWYYGVKESDGSMFDNAYKRGAPYQFTLGRGEVIAGWDQGIGMLNKGGKGVLFIPSTLAYGKAGSGAIGADEDLMFYVELE